MSAQTHSQPSSGARTRADSLSRRKKLIFTLIAVAVPLLALEASARLLLVLWPESMIEATLAGRAIQTNAFHNLHADLDLQDARTAARLYQPSAELFWTLRPNTHLEPENIVYVARGDPLRWPLSINADGHRGAPYPDSPGGGPVVACFGDSCTFGYRIGDDATYPAQLQEYLRSAGMPDARVVNYGVPGYTSFQGRRLVEQVLAKHRPDVVVLAFGANDHERDLYPDSIKAQRIHPLGVRLAALLDHIALAKVARGLIFYQAEPTSIETLPQRVSQREYVDNLQAMIRSAKSAGARVIVLDLVFFGPVNHSAMAAVARAEGAEWVDGPDLFERTLKQIVDGERFQQERSRADRFWAEELTHYRQVYYNAEQYRRMFSMPYWSAMLRYLLIEPVHPTELGYRVIAEELGKMMMQPGNGETAQPKSVGNVPNEESK